jgi:hypothetical protein
MPALPDVGLGQSRPPSSTYFVQTPRLTAHIVHSRAAKIPLVQPFIRSSCRTMKNTGVIPHHYGSAVVWTYAHLDLRRLPTRH